MSIGAPSTLYFLEKSISKNILFLDISHTGLCSIAIVKWDNGETQRFETVKSDPDEIEKHMFILPHPEQGFYHLNENKVIHVIDSQTRKTVLTESQKEPPKKNSRRPTVFSNFTTTNSYYFPKTNVLIHIDDGGARDYIWWWNLSRYDRDANFDHPCDCNTNWNSSLSIHAVEDQYAIGSFRCSENKTNSLLLFDTENMIIEYYERDEVPDRFLKYSDYLATSSDDDEEDEEDEEEQEIKVPIDPSVRAVKSRQRQFTYKAQSDKFDQAEIDDWLSLDHLNIDDRIIGLDMALDSVIRVGPVKNMITLLDNRAKLKQETLDQDLFLGRRYTITRDREAKWSYFMGHKLYRPPEGYPTGDIGLGYCMNDGLHERDLFWYKLLKENGLLNDFFRERIILQATRAIKSTYDIDGQLRLIRGLAELGFDLKVIDCDLSSLERHQSAPLESRSSHH